MEVGEQRCKVGDGQRKGDVSVKVTCESDLWLKREPLFNFTLILSLLRRISSQKCCAAIRIQTSARARLGLRNCSEHFLPLLNGKPYDFAVLDRW